MLHINITKCYKKEDKNTPAAISREDKNIATGLHLADRISCTNQKPAYITLKDHKNNFETTPTCRLINPSKSEIGKISKHILDKFNSNITKKLHLNQWKNTNSVLNWFNNIKNKKAHAFIEFDIVDFYPSITADLAVEVVSKR